MEARRAKSNLIGPQQQRVFGLLAIFLSALSYGAMPLVAHFFFEGGGDPVQLAYFRFFFSSLLCAIILPSQRIPFRLQRHEYMPIGVLGISYGLVPILLFLSYAKLDSGVATILHFSFPLFVMFFCFLFFKDKPGLRALIAAAFCVVGIIFINLTPQHGHIVSYSSLGAFLAVLSGVANAAYITIFAKMGPASMPMFKVVFYMNSIPAILMTPYVMSHYDWNLSLMAWLTGIFMAILCSIFATLTLQYGITKTSPQEASLLSTLEPVTSVLLGVFVLHEVLTGNILIGIVAILMGSLLLAFQDPKANPSDVEVSVTEQSVK
ncbi:MAG: EamA family transporter [Eubacteriales bacterium]|nr:EamA family transporter [Eubacteriales bacterium]